MPDVSVIVPVYNIKTLLPRCVASLQAQTWQDFEVWLVDDGSTDGSGELCDEYAVKDARIHALHKENGGQGSARDLGLDHARGEYICYVDSDDEVLPDLLDNDLTVFKSECVPYLSGKTVTHAECSLPYTSRATTSTAE